MISLFLEQWIESSQKIFLFLPRLIGLSWCCAFSFFCWGPQPQTERGSITASCQLDAVLLWTEATMASIHPLLFPFFFLTPFVSHLISCSALPLRPARIRSASLCLPLSLHILSLFFLFVFLFLSPIFGSSSALRPFSTYSLSLRLPAVSHVCVPLDASVALQSIKEASLK